MPILNRWLVTDAGLATVEAISTTVPAGAIYNYGAAFKDDGTRYIKQFTGTVASTDIRIAGVLHTFDGAMYVVTTSPSGGIRKNGWLLNNAGAVYIEDAGTVDVFKQGIGLTSVGALATTGTSAYVTSANDYDGSNDYQTRGAGLTGASDGKQGTLSVWFRFDGGDGVRQDILDSATVLGGAVLRFGALKGTDNKFQIAAFNSAGTTLLNIFSVAAYSAGATWIHLLSSWKLDTAGARHIYVNDASDLSVTTFTDGTIDYTVADWSIGANPAGSFKLNGCMSEFFFHTTYIDLSVEANRRKFITSAGKPAFLGTDGSLPLGVQPLIYAPDGDASDNNGSGGNLTTTGALTACSTSPSD